MGEGSTRAPTDVGVGVLVACSASMIDEPTVTGLRSRGFAVSYAAGSGSAADELRDVEANVVIVDDLDPGWLRAVSDLLEEFPGVRVVAVTRTDLPEEFLAALNAGVCGFVAAGSSAEAVARTISAVVESGHAIPRAYLPILVDEVRHGRGRVVRAAGGPVEVTDREWDILQLLLQRRSTREMADALFVSVGTVRSHVSTLLRKLGASDREDAIRMVERGAR